MKNFVLPRAVPGSDRPHLKIHYLLVGLSFSWVLCWGVFAECCQCSVLRAQCKQLNSNTNIFQLQELHVYLVPGSCWQQGRNLATKTIENDTISLGFVR